MNGKRSSVATLVDLGAKEAWTWEKWESTPFETPENALFERAFCHWGGGGARYATLEEGYSGPDRQSIRKNNQQL